MSRSNSPTTTFEDQFSEEIWDSTYKDHGDQTVDDTMYRVAKGIASAEPTEELKTYWTDLFYEYLSGFRMTTGGRIYSNGGTEWGGTTMFNCFVSPTVKSDVDSLDGIIKNLAMQGKTLKSEGGWGENFSYLRPRGSFIAGIGVESPGAVKYMELYDKSSDIITSGSGLKSTNPKAKKKIRKGAQMGVLDVTHPDIIEFITAKQQAGRLSKFNISVNCTDEFMEKVIKITELQNKIDSLLEDGIDAEEYQIELMQTDTWNLEFPDTTHPAYEAEWQGHLSEWKAAGYPVNVYNTVKVSYLWDLISDSTYNRAEPGILFLDRANKLAPSNYTETIKATNPSMPAGTLVQTKTGIYPIEELEDLEFKVKSMDGTWADAKCFLSGESEDLVTIDFGGMKKVSSTKQHRWPVYDTRQKRIYKVYADELKVGDMIPKNRNELAGIEGDMSFTRDEGFMIGQLIGDGWISKRADGSGYAAGFVFSSEELPEAERVLNILNSFKSDASTITQKKDSPEYYIQTTSKEFIEDYLLGKWQIDIDDVKKVPKALWTSNDDCIIGFVDGLFSSDGFVSKDKKNAKVTLTTSKEALALEIMKLLSFYGVVASTSMQKTKAVFPNGVDYNKLYTRYDVTLSSHNIVKFNNIFDISHSRKSDRLAKLAFEIDNSKTRKVSHFNFVKGIELDTTGHRVWDVSVYHNEHVFPTIYGYTGNCGEQMLPPAGICCLSSINVAAFLNEDRTGFDLDELREAVKVAVRFLDNVNSVSNTPLPEYDHSRDHKRRIGVGVIGWGSALYLLKTRFGSDRANELRDEMMKTIAQQAYMSSIDLAEEKGMFTYCQPEEHAKSEFVARLDLPEEYMQKLRTTGIRNSSLLSIQPTGNTSIFANVLSGGLEPVFMHEYIRTVIVNHMPDELVGVCPKWYEGEWYETEIFKADKEGDEDILRGVGPESGTVYKIDVNRGLTKEVLCEDYGVRHMKRLGEWDANADWAATTLDLSVEDHLTDLAGFTKYIDSSCSKTINVPEDYDFEAFKNVYLDGYKTGTIKGITTYRANSMTSVLSAKEEKVADESQEEIILDDVKLPETSSSETKILRAENKKLYCTVTFFPETNRPFALFVKSNHAETSLVADEAVSLLTDLANTKGIPQVHIDDQLKKMTKDNNINKVARLVSLNLRHGVFIKNVVATLDKSENAVAGSFTFAIKKLLSNYVNDGERVEGVVCQECGSDHIVFESGCHICKACGSSKCG